MRWQNPIAWMGMAALLLPVLVHLFSRRQTRTLPFPSLRFVSTLPLLPTRRTSLSDVALLLLRVAILAIAVAALAAPLLERHREAVAFARASADTGAITNSSEVNNKAPRVVIVDTSLDAVADSTRRARRDRRVDALAAERRNVLVVRTPVPHATLAGAQSWLQQQPAGSGLASAEEEDKVGDIVVVSDFGAGTVDSMDLSALAANIRLTLERAALRSELNTAAPAAEARNAGAGTVLWWIGADTSGSDAVRRAVQARGGALVISYGASPADATVADSVNADAAAGTGVTRTRRVIVASIDASSKSPRFDRVLVRAAPLSSPWMGDLIATVLRDTVIRSALGTPERDDSEFADFVLPEQVTVLTRASNGAPLLAAAAVADSGGDRLLLLSRMPPASLATAALLLATSHAVFTTSSLYVATPATASGFPTDVMLRNWERAPSGAVPRPRDLRHAGADAGPSDGRYLWVLVLLLLGAEAVMRRPRAAKASRTADVAPVGHD